MRWLRNRSYFGELQLAFLIGGVREVVVRLRQAQLERERVADSHAVFAVQHEGDRPRDIGVERQRDQSNMLR
jgi:hypothetical protein